MFFCQNQNIDFYKAFPIVLFYENAHSILYRTSLLDVYKYYKQAPLILDVYLPACILDEEVLYNDLGIKCIMINSYEDEHI